MKALSCKEFSLLLRSKEIETKGKAFGIINLPKNEFNADKIYYEPIINKNPCIFLFIDGYDNTISYSDLNTAQKIRLNNLIKDINNK